MIVAVSRETRLCEEAVYTRLLAWAVWVTGRRNIPDRIDELAGTFRITPCVHELLQRVRRRRFPAEINAIEKAVAAMRAGADGELLFEHVDSYFLKWQSIEAIALERRENEFHVINRLQRAIRRIARELPACETRVACQR